MKKDIFVYTATFEYSDGAVCVSFPDLPDVNTFGDNVEHAIEMAQEALYAYLDMCTEDKTELPTPTEPSAIPAPNGGFTSAILVDMKAMRAKYSSKPIKKTLTIPEWLNAEAEKQNINFSATLQEALKEKLGV